MARRDQTPPYEIMRASPRTPGGTGGDVEPVQADPGEAPPAASPTPATPTNAPWWVGSSAPLVLRVPRGMAVAAVLGVLGVIVVAYFVGTIRGAAASQPEAADAPLGERAGPSGWYESSDTAYQGPEVEVPEDPLVAERREPGLNYMQLISSTRADCERLAAFFGSRGVAIQLVPVNNKGLWTAYAVKRGYRADELGSESCKRYEQQLRSLGRQWKIHNNNRGTDLATMIFSRYDGPGG